MDTMSSERQRESLLRRRWDEIWAYVRLLGVDASAADDVVQETFLRALPPAGAGDDVEPALLRRIAKGVVIDRARGARRRAAILRAEAAERVWERRVAEPGYDAVRAALRACLETLATRDRDVVDRFYGERVAARTIGAQLGVSEGAVTSILHRARRRLRACVERRIRHE